MTLHLNLDEVFLYMTFSTLNMTQQIQHKVVNQLAYKLIEWEDVSYAEIREVFKKYGYHFDELCSNCNNFVEYECEGTGNPLCIECSIENTRS